MFVRSAWGKACRVLAATLATWIAISGAVPGASMAHAPTFAVYSKYEATTSGRSIAFVFALDRAAISQLLERDVVHAKVEPNAIDAYRDFFSRYVFDRFFVTNDGAPCTHPERLGRFFWDEKTGRVVAVTKYTCPSDLVNLTIRSLVTHDTPTSHELFGDLEHNGNFVRSLFYGDDVEVEISLPSLSLPRPPLVTPRARRRGNFSYVTIPDTVRRYDDLARAELGVDFPSSPAVPPASLWRALARFVGQGIVHIFTGYDHVLFIVTLTLVVSTWRHLAVVVTAFTAAHSLTLIAATLGLFTVPDRVVEPLIALTVLVVAVDAVLRPRAKARALVAFAFGLIHGLGLSSALRALGLSGGELLPALVGFNLGVEIGQLLIVAPLFALVVLLRKNEGTFGRVRSVLGASVAVVALFWIVQRVREAFAG